MFKRLRPRRLPTPKSHRNATRPQRLLALEQLESREAVGSVLTHFFGVSPLGFLDVPFLDALSDPATISISEIARPSISSLDSPPPIGSQSGSNPGRQADSSSRQRTDLIPGN